MSHIFVDVAHVPIKCPMDSSDVLLSATDEDDDFFQLRCVQNN